jgi:hypothetical protein
MSAKGGAIMKANRKILLWAPRLLLIVFALLLVGFSFDVFEQGKGAMATGIAFVAHNIPTLILGLVVFAAWRREWIGLLSCLVLAVAYIVWFWGRFPLVVYCGITGPLFLIAALYAVNWHLRSHANRIP